jgi:hypothetical protein
MADYLAYDAEYTGRRIKEMLDAFPELRDDDDLRADMIEGETDFNRVMSRLVRARQERQAHADGLADYIGDLETRKARLDRAAAGIKALMLDLMTHAGTGRVVLPEATISITKARQKLDVHNKADLPQGYFTMEPVPDNAAIRAALDAGEDIPGARLVTGEPGLTVRVK